MKCFAQGRRASKYLKLDCTSALSDSWPGALSTVMPPNCLGETTETQPTHKKWKAFMHMNQGRSCLGKGPMSSTLLSSGSTSF